MIRLSNYVLGEWREGSAPFRNLENPSTGEIVAETSSKGLDFKAIHAYAREVGGPTLRSMTFAERGALLKAMSRAVYAQRERLIDIATANGGNTRKDAKFDLDGATATLSYYASVGKGLGDKHTLSDGESVQLGMSARFHGSHVSSSLLGVAIHINAFNFPAWGAFEKAACAILAGVPVISKPATSTSWLAWEIVKILTDEEVLPPGVFQLICGGAGDLLDHTDGQDAIAFTGSADTGAIIRGCDGHVKRSARINIEADSLNAAIIGPDVEVGSDVWFAAVRNITTEMTQKAGQKCTAIRRVLVPASLMDELQETLIAELDGIVVGDPTDPDVRMGPLSSASQLREYREGVELLATEATIVYGSTTEIKNSKGADKGGHFAGPVLLRCDSPAVSVHIHSREVFGPVCTIMPYENDCAETCAYLIQLGGGSLATSVYSSEKRFLKKLLPKIVTSNGRVLVVDKKVSDTATGHGMVMPQMVHGGPGRAGGGEELGGLRGLSLYMQRTAIQGNKALMERIFGD